MRVVETRHQKKQYWLVFKGMDIVGKFNTLQEAQEYIKQNK
jgi:hypothetical protein